MSEIRKPEAAAAERMICRSPCREWLTTGSRSSNRWRNSSLLSSRATAVLCRG